MNSQDFIRIVGELEDMDDAFKQAEYLETELRGEPMNSVYTIILLNAVGREVHEMLSENHN